MAIIRAGRAASSRSALRAFGAAVLAAVIAASAIPAEASLKASLKKELRQHDLKPERIWDCHRRGDGSAVCQWRAVGHPKVGPAYECEGKARLIGGDRWRIDKCDEHMVPLLSKPGPHPAFGYNDDWLLPSDRYPRRIDLLHGASAEVARHLISWRSISPTSPFSLNVGQTRRSLQPVHVHRD
jgi:hypothetical protein